MPPCSSPLLSLCPFLITEIPITANGLSEQKLQRFSHPPPPISPRPENNPKMHIKKSDTGSYLHTSLAMIDFSDDTHLAGTAFNALIFFFHCEILQVSLKCNCIVAILINISSFTCASQNDFSLSVLEPQSLD